MENLELHRGDLVEVKSPGEILATLDAQGRYEGLPFMPEMAQFCGQRFPVRARADKLCDTVNYSGSRRLPDGVLLGDVRCDGSGHDGCQAACRIFWKTAWLRRVVPDMPASPPFPHEDVELLRQRTQPYTRSESEANGKTEITYVCQNTELPKCTELLNLWNPGPYINEYTSGNVSFRHFLTVTTRAAITEPKRKLGLVPEIHLPGTASKDERFPALDLQPGEWVRVKSKEEIARTLTSDGRSFGMWFDKDMFPHCGKVYRVRQRISRFVHEPNGKMLTPKMASVTLEGVVCSGDYAVCRWFCPREIYPYWREFWLERVAAPK
ncbi:hypothetical protein [Hyphomicrobium sp. ghe19]|uniref:hypothetical protein n=1 Tax=Hyphomicrobium sp. ghe19 TaxID=2682968 RepID=UPI001367880D|nr:hypothetical protein HYPP_02824 [Hyphomicrobium sp. ghe19]